MSVPASRRRTRTPRLLRGRCRRSGDGCASDRCHRRAKGEESGGRWGPRGVPRERESSGRAAKGGSGREADKEVEEERWGHQSWRGGKGGKGRGGGRSAPRDEGRKEGGKQQNDDGWTTVKSHKVRPGAR